MPPRSPLICNVCGHHVDPRASLFLIECHFCTRWFHGACVEMRERDALLVAKFACHDCKRQGYQSITYDPPQGLLHGHPLSFSPLPVHLTTLTTPSRHKKTSASFRRLLNAAIYARSGVRFVASEDVHFSFLQQTTLDDPILFLGNNHQLAGLDDPFPTFDAPFVTKLLADNHVVQTTDVATQTAHPVTASTWPRILSETVDHDAVGVENAEFPLTTKVAPPLAVTHVAWRYLLSDSRTEPVKLDMVGAFLASNVYLDFTVAPKGQCTWLSVTGGVLWVYLIPPSTANWNLYREWKQDAEWATVFLAERVEKCIKCTVTAGNTLLVPAGWSYARYAGGVQWCSYFCGFFSCTTVMDTQLGVLLLEQQLGQSSIPLEWITVDVTVLIWTRIRYLLQHFLTKDGSTTDQDRRAVRRAVPRLREWSAIPASLMSANGLGWVPRSQQEAQAIVEQLEQMLNVPNSTLNLASSGPDDHKVPPLSPNEASYLYSGASQSDSSIAALWPSAAFDSHSCAPMWTTYDALPVEQLPLSMNNQAYVHDESVQFDDSYGPKERDDMLPIYSSSTVPPIPGRHRASCHRCGNLRKHNLPCLLCPHIFCVKCADKMYDEHGPLIFEHGCPVCKQKCCCGKNRSTQCVRKFHCYKKCPATKRPATG